MTHTPATQPLSDGALAMLGVPLIAYVKPVTIDGQTAYEVHAADGSRLAVLPTSEAAIGAAIQNDLEVLSLH